MTQAQQAMAALPGDGEPRRPIPGGQRQGSDGEDVFLHDLWPSPEYVQEVVADALRLAAIPAPTGQEGARAAAVEAILHGVAGLEVRRDGVGNVVARVPGRRSVPDRRDCRCKAGIISASRSESACAPVSYGDGASRSAVAIVAVSLSLKELSNPLGPVVDAQQRQGRRLMISVIDDQGRLIATPQHERILLTVLDTLPGADEALRAHLLAGGADLEGRLGDLLDLFPLVMALGASVLVRRHGGSIRQRPAPWSAVRRPPLRARGRPDNPDDRAARPQRDDPEKPAPHVRALR